MADKFQSDFQKKKLQAFLQDILKVGCTKGFRYFSLYLRGREELLMKVQNEQLLSSSLVQNTSNISLTESIVEDDQSSSYLEKKSLPRPYDSLMLSKSTQRSLSGFHFLDIGLPPASPCEYDLKQADVSSTLFLVAAYARYMCPYVWVRSNHNRLIKFSDCLTSDDDVYQIQNSPLKLKSCSNWLFDDVKLWDVLAEVVRINVVPCPRNPFAVDYAYFDSLSAEECILATGAMIHFLNRVLLSGDHSYNTKISSDLNELTKRHFKEMNHAVNQTQNTEAVY